MRYNPQAWFWLADDGRVFDSSRALIVDKTDAIYAAWVAAGGTASRWPVDTTGAQTNDPLQWVFDNAGIAVFVVFASLQTALCADIDKQAQLIRDLYVTPGGAQAATYLFKQSQAQAAQAAQSGVDSGKTAAQLASAYPYLANEIGITVDPSSSQPATDVYGVARAVVATVGAWQPLNLAIEATRLKTKMAINAATTAAAAQAAHDAVSWPPAP